MECARTILQSSAPFLNALFNSPDDLKFSSSMSLFSVLGAEEICFQRALKRWCAGQPDKQTLALLSRLMR